MTTPRIVMNTNHSDRNSSMEGIKPVKVMEVEISCSLPVISSLNKVGSESYGSAIVLARLHSEPLGLIKIDLEEEELPAQELANLIWDRLQLRINRHLENDGLQPVESLTPQGVPFSSDAKCVLDRTALLVDAPLISIVLATRERVQSLAFALDSIANLEYPKFELVLVDSAPSTSQTRDFYTLNKARFAAKNICMRYVRTDVPGLAVAHNRGLEIARGSIIAFTDDDVLVDRFWLLELLRAFKSATNVGCVTGLVIPMELETPAQVLFEQFGGFTKGFDPQIYDMDGHRSQNVLYPYTAGRFGTGANMAFSAGYLQKAGGFDPALGVGTPTLGADDMAAFFGVIKDGYQLVYQPSAVVLHRHRRTYEELRRQIFGYGSGLTAFLTKCILDDPVSVFTIAAKMPAGFRYAFGPDSNKNQHKSGSYPKELEGTERRGMLYGPVAYIRSSLRYRRQKWHKPDVQDESAAVPAPSADSAKPERGSR